MIGSLRSAETRDFACGVVPMSVMARRSISLPSTFMFMDMDQKQRCADDIHERKAHLMMEEISLIRKEVEMLPGMVSKVLSRCRIP